MFFFTDLVDLQGTEVTPANKPLGPADVFVSYCWLNSEKANKSKQVTTDISGIFVHKKRTIPGVSFLISLATR